MSLRGQTRGHTDGEQMAQSDGSRMATRWQPCASSRAPHLAPRAPVLLVGVILRRRAHPHARLRDAPVVGLGPWLPLVGTASREVHGPDGRLPLHLDRRRRGHVVESKVPEQAGHARGCSEVFGAHAQGGGRGCASQPPRTHGGGAGGGRRGEALFLRGVE